MKHFTAILVTIFLFASNSYTQCTNDLDWGDEGFGVSPDPGEGETFANGALDVPYSDDIHIKVPSDSGDLVEGTNFTVDSVRLDGVTLTLDGTSYTLEEVGLTLNCNNNGTLPNPCAFLGGQEGCGTISGTPLIAGNFNVTIEGTVFVGIFGAIDSPFDGYTLLIDEETTVQEIREPVSDLKVTPNPFSNNATVELNAFESQMAEFKIYTLLGEEKLSETISLSVGSNKLKISANDLESGIYLYHIEIGEYRVTKRLVVNK